MVTEELLYDASYSINTAIVSKSIKKIGRNSIRQLGENLCASLGLVNKMIGLPSKLLGLLHFERSVVFYDTKARILAQLTKNGEDNSEEAYRKELDKVIESEFLPESEKIAEGAVEGGKYMFKEMLEKNEIGLRETYDAILDSSTVWIWCSFEVLMRELWKQSLNEGGKYLGNVVIKKLQSQDGKTDKIQGKYIRLDYLAKFNYDVSKNLGTILLDKFDFTSCSGICEAYECAFPRSGDIKKALISKKLNELEAARNVIVHNAGIIDSAFCKRTSTSLAEIGKRIRLNNRKVCEYGNAVAEVGIAMMLAVYRNMAYIRSEVKKQIGE